MSKAALTSFCVDLKLTPDGAVKILEFGDLYMSAYSGYRRLTDKSILKEAVFPFYGQWGVPVYQDDEGINRESDYAYEKGLSYYMRMLPLAVDSARPFDPGRIEAHSCILLSPGFSTETQRRKLQQPPFDRAIVTNSNPLLNACFDDKATTAAFAALYAPQLFPAQKLYPVEKKGQIDVAALLSDFAGHDTVVIKNARGANADGVGLLRLQGLRRAFALHAAGGYLKYMTKPSFSAGDLCIVEDYVKGKTIRAENARGEEGEYDPTMRVVLTVWHDNGRTHVKCHDAYYKVPAQPVGRETGAVLRRGSRISKISNDRGPKSTFVPDEDKALVFRQLEDGLPAMLGPLITTPSHVFVRRFLNSDDEALRRVGFALAIDKDYFDRPADSDEYPADIAAGLFGMRDRMPLFDRLFWPLGASYAPEGLGTLVRRFAAESGTRVSSGQGKAALAFVSIMAAFIGGLVWAASWYDNWAGGHRAETRLNTVFSAEARHVETVRGVDNLRLAFFDTERHFNAGIQDRVAAQAAAEGYELCARWDGAVADKGRYHAIRAAVNHNDISFALVNIGEGDDGDAALLSESRLYALSCPAITPDSPMSVPVI